MNTGHERGCIAYPTLPNPLTARDLKQRFTPWPDEIEWAFIATRTAEARLGLLTLLKVFETLGRFIRPKAIPPEVVRHIARHIGLPERDALAYTKNTLYRHQGLVREFLGVTKWNAEAYHVAESVIERLASARTQPADLINGAIETLVRERFELPALRSLRRMVGTLQQRNHDRLFELVTKQLTATHRAALDELLEVPKGAKESPFAKLCRPPGRATAKNLKALAGHLDWLETLAVPPTGGTGGNHAH